MAEKKEKPMLELKTLAEVSHGNFVRTLDTALDFTCGGGIAQGQVIEIFGVNSSGKTTLSLEIAARFLKAIPDKKVVYFNYENQVDTAYVNNILKATPEMLDRFKVAEPDSLEKGMEFMLKLMDEGSVSLFIIDSLAAMMPEAELDKNLNKAQVGGFKAKLMGELCRKIASRLNAGCQSTIIFINHVNVLLETGFSFIKKDTTPGGDAVKFIAGLRLRVSLFDKETKEEILVGSKKPVKVPVVHVLQLLTEKNKYFPPFRRGLIYVKLGTGLDRTRSLLDYAIELGFIKRSTGEVYEFSKPILGKMIKKRGKPVIIAELDKETKVRSQLFKMVWEKLATMIQDAKTGEGSSLFSEYARSIQKSQIEAEDEYEEEENEDEISREVSSTFEDLGEGNPEDTFEDPEE